MPSSAVRSFTDLYDYQSSIRAASDLKLSVTGAGSFEAELTRIDLHRLWAQRGQSSLAQIVYAAIANSRIPIFFLAHPNQPPVMHSGVELASGDFMFYAQKAEHHLRFPAGTCWGGMSLSPDDLAAAGQAVAGRDISPPAVSKRIRPPPRLMARLLNLHQAACHLAAALPGVLEHPEVARAIEQEMVRVMVGCIAEGVATDGPGLRELRVPVMRRFERALEESKGRPLYVAEICAAIGVSDRMLRLRCMEELGMSPLRYLWLRRMHMARRALARAEAGATSVTEVAMNCGFGELGRFSVGYHRLFGETPSATLRRVADDPPVLRERRVETGRFAVML